MSITLSLCIPTYNRARFLPDLICSITKQYTPCIEVVIVDNGSTDTTRDLLSHLHAQYPWISYECFLNNQGPDRSFLSTAELAKGTFCWFLGDDDIIEDDSISYVLSRLHDTYTGITLRRAAYDISLSKRWMEPSSLITDRIWHDSNQSIQELFPLLGFLSGHILHRARLHACMTNEDLTPYYNAYSLVYLMGRMMQRDPIWQYLHRPCVGWRSGNDSFAKELGRTNRLLLDITSYHTIIQGLQVHSKQLSSLHACIVRTHLTGHVQDLLCQYHEPFRRKIFYAAWSRYAHTQCFWTHFLPMLLSPRWFVRSMRTLIKIFRHTSKMLHALILHMVYSTVVY